MATSMEYQQEPIIVPAQAAVSDRLGAVRARSRGRDRLVLVEEQKLDAAVGRVAMATKSEAKARAELTDVANASVRSRRGCSELQTENGRLTVKVAAAAKVEPASSATALSKKKARNKHSATRMKRNIPVGSALLSDIALGNCN